MERGSVTRLAGVLAAGGAVVALAACSGQAPRTDGDNVVRGKQLFVSKCGSCHVLGRAQTKGNIGPNLDAAFRQSLGEGFGRSAVRGVVEYQIQHPQGGQMPANLVEGDDRNAVAAYVATSASKGGEDGGLLANAVKKAGGGAVAAEKAGKLDIDADPSGQLAFVTNKATATAGSVTVTMDNGAPIQHNIAIKQGSSVIGQGKIVGKGGVSAFKANLKAGTYEFFCEVQGHEAGGMKGSLTVR